ncbi:sulfatase-like hydrolase/transferase [Polaribacter sp. Asnod6-C07]|uniref:sulfatase-like hydrolase/transferase n=1 Tax=Polaribacter sp. Asnod6-C07 TaxID=3160582 RepID=UPI003866E0AA
MKKLPKLLTVFFLLFTLIITAQKKETKPNILFILADDLGYADLSATGSTFYETPNIDKIVNEGTVFTNGYANSRVCSQSRARHYITIHVGLLLVKLGSKKINLQKCLL